MNEVRTAQQCATPGPWATGYDGRSIYGPDRDFRGSGMTTHVVARANSGTATTAENLANARLIANAPELLAACQRVLRAIDWARPGDRMSSKDQAARFREAIEQAGGEV